MKYLGLDLGTKTLGIAISDKNGIISMPYDTLKINNEDYKSVISEIKYIFEKENTIGERALKTLDFQKMLENELDIEVFMQDERLSTVSSEKFLIKNNMSRKKRKQVIDKMAAQIILQSFLDKTNNERIRD